MKRSIIIGIAAFWGLQMNAQVTVVTTATELTSAFTAGTSGQTVSVQLGNDIALDATVTMSLAGTYTLDLAGHTISAPSGASVRAFNINAANVVLNLTDTSVNADGSIDGGKVSRSVAGPCIYMSNGRFNMTAGHITNFRSSANGGAIYVSGGTFNMSGGVLGDSVYTETWQVSAYSPMPASLEEANGNSGYDGGAVYIDSNGTAVFSDQALLRGNFSTDTNKNFGGGAVFSKGRLSINGGVFEYNRGNCGGAVNVNSSAKFFTMTGGILRNNFANRPSVMNDTANGGGLYVYSCGSSSSPFVISGGTISGNVAQNSGGGLKFYIAYMKFERGEDENGNPTEAVLDGNVCLGRGGGIYTESGKLTVNGLTVSNNVSVYGGGLGTYSGNSGSWELRHITIIGNEATRYGGGIQSSYDLSIYDSVIKDNFVSNTGSDGNGGGIHVSASTTISNTVFENNSVHIDGGAIYSGGSSCKIISGELKGNSAGRNGGGIYLSSSNSTVTIQGGTMSGNTASSGAGMYVAAGTVTMSGGSFSGNTSTGAGGGLYIGSGNLNMNGGGFSSNEAGTHGGGAYVAGGTVTMSAGEFNGNHTVNGNGGGIFISKGIFKMTGGSILDNEARMVSATSGKGGGLYVSSNSNLLVTIAAGTISGNSAQSHGGGIGTEMSNSNVASLLIGATCPDSSLSLDSDGLPTNVTVSAAGPVISNNTAILEGGGICMHGTSKIYMYKGGITSNGVTGANGVGGGINMADAGSFFYLYDGAVTSNTVTTDGGGIRIGGGGSVRMVGGSVASNTSGNRGGGLFVDGGQILLEGSSINQNNAVDGAGAYVNSGSVTIQGRGTYINGNNASRNGGGIYAGGGTVTFSDGDITSNSALNGGGIYLISGAHMTFYDGVLGRNNAIAPAGVSLGTAYHGITGSGQDIQGIGGGIYVGSGESAQNRTTLTINGSGGETNRLGIYANSASYGADDIFADGLYTQVTVPDVSDMHLTDFVGDADLKWHEDFISGDTSYGNSDVAKDEHELSTYLYRYREALQSHPEDVRSVTASNASRTDMYVCLVLSYQLCDLVIRRYGLHLGESAVYDVFDAIGSVHYKIAVHGTGADYVDVKITNVAIGEYTATETPWAWAYAISEPSGNPASVTHNLLDSNLFSFQAEHKTGPSSPVHDESYREFNLVPASNQ